MYILHIETSTKICSVAISSADHLLFVGEVEEGMNHTAILPPLIERLLAQNDLSVQHLGAISISSGPGSYTGLRVGGSLAKSMAYSLGIPLIGIPTLESIALAALDTHPEATHVLPMIDARRDEVYTAFYDRDMHQVLPESAMHIHAESLQETISNCKMVVCCGDGSFKVRPFMSELENLLVDTGIVCSAKHLVKPAWQRWLGGRLEDPLHFSPYYLKPPNITRPRKVG